MIGAFSLITWFVQRDKSRRHGHDVSTFIAHFSTSDLPSDLIEELYHAFLGPKGAAVLPDDRVSFRDGQLIPRHESAPSVSISDLFAKYGLDRPSDEELLMVATVEDLVLLMERCSKPSTPFV